MNLKRPLVAGLVLGGLFVCSSVGIAQIMAFTANTYAVGVNPMSVAVADFNGDGKPDLVTANYGNGNGSTLSVLTNNGSGTFGSNATLTVGFPFPGPFGTYQAPYGVAAIDVNQDGKPDLVSANYGNGVGKTLTILTNNGAGIFGSNATIVVDAGPQCVASGDVNGDGKIDLICANYSAGSLTILTNSGNGNFGSNITLKAVSKSGYVVVTDLNNDSKVDLVCACQDLTTSKLVVFTNSGSGGFGSNATLNLAGQCRQLASVDINFDGKTDLVATAFSSFGGPAAALVIFTNSGASFNFSVRFPVSANSLSMVATDSNGDNKVDLVSANGDDKLTLMINDGAGNFSVYATPNVGSHPLSIAAADVNGDGKMDFITANSFDNTVTVLTQTNVAAPTLNITSVSNSVRLSWTSLATGFVIQTNSDLATINWVAAPYGINISNGVNQSLTVTSPVPASLFFRLKH